MIERVLEVKVSLITVLEELEWDSLATSECKILEGIKTCNLSLSLLSLSVVRISVYPMIMEIKMHFEEVLDFNTEMFYHVRCVVAYCYHFVLTCFVFS